MIKLLKHTALIRLDEVGFIASGLCAIHCAAMPFIIIFLSLYGLEFFADPAVEILFITTSLLIGTLTFRHGYFRHHKKLYPFLVFASGLLIVLLGHLFIHRHSDQGLHDVSAVFFITPAGALLIGIGHYLNRKLSKSVKSCNC